MTNEHGSPRRIYQNPEMDEPVWLCDPCQKVFATNYSLRRHMRLIHKAPKTLIRIDATGVRRGEPVW